MTGGPEHLRAVMQAPETTTVAIIGTRNPSRRQRVSADFCARRVAELMLDLVTGGAEGIDTAAQQAFDEAKGGIPATTVYRPTDVRDDDRRRLREVLAASLGESWTGAIARQGEYVLRLALRNVLIVQAADVVLAWPGPRGGGTAQGMTIARHLGVPCFDMNERA